MQDILRPTNFLKHAGDHNLKRYPAPGNSFSEFTPRNHRLVKSTEHVSESYHDVSFKNIFSVAMLFELPWAIMQKYSFHTAISGNFFEQMNSQCFVMLEHILEVVVGFDGGFDWQRVQKPWKLVVQYCGLVF